MSRRTSGKGSGGAYGCTTLSPIGPGRTLLRVLNAAAGRRFARVVFYPLHEETLKRMGVKDAEPFHRRTGGLEELLDHIGADRIIDVTIDRWEGRRKKYTPMDMAFRFLEEKYMRPHFVCMTLPVANVAAGFDSFGFWIRRVRLLLFGRCGACAGALHAAPSASCQWPPLGLDLRLSRINRPLNLPVWRTHAPKNGCRFEAL